MAIDNKVTTIKVYKETKSRLDKLKVSKGESYDEIVQKILHILNICKSNPLDAKQRLKDIDRIKSLRKKA
jgi:hypothetical protein